MLDDIKFVFAKSSSKINRGITEVIWTSKDDLQWNAQKLHSLNYPEVEAIIGYQLAQGGNDQSI